ncbi:MAG: tRNA dihydrouridine synthase DusB [Bacteroidales bacterium]|jgi:nifR3 family TIM-barrel protein|nr:tRNA dihydrouridine synthase DusB [Bacteroidales bacterium]
MNLGSLKLPNRAVLLAPLEDITDLSYRLICRKMGADMVFTEFISSDGLVRDADKSIKKMRIYEEERPVGIQIFGSDLQQMVMAAQMAEEAAPDTIDINWGCPVRKVVSKGAGSGILKDILKMIAITAAVVKAVKLPVTVKTRLGYDESDKPIVEVAERLQDVGIAAITIHGRTRAQMYSGKADWTLIGKVKANPRMKIPVIGNGDIDSPQKALEMFERYGVDGIMIGRAAIGNPWIFTAVKSFLQTGTLISPPSLNERIEVCLAHLDKAVEIKGEKRAILEMRKFYSGYFKGIPHFKTIRMEIMQLTSLIEIRNRLQQLM